MRYEIIDVEQGSKEWFEARMGIPTASRFKDILAEGKGDGRLTYMRQLAGEIITGEPMQTYVNDDMKRGIEQEPLLRTAYAFHNACEIRQVGFVKMHWELYRAGCSPDGLIGDDGMVEFKSMRPDLLLGVLETNKVPNHAAQVQGGLWIMERKWCDVVFGWRNMPQHVVRYRRDEPFMASLASAVKAFNRDLNDLVQRIKDRF